MNLDRETKLFFERLQGKRQQVLQKIQAGLQVNEFILHFSQNLTYSNKMNDEFLYKSHFQKLFKTVKKCNQTEYPKKLKSCERQLIAQIAQSQEDSAFLVQDSFMKESQKKTQSSRIFQVDRRQEQKQELKQSREFQKSKIKFVPIEERVVSYKKQREESKQQVGEIRKKQGSSAIKQPKNGLIRQEWLSYKPQNLKDEEFEEISSNQVFVQIRYFSPKVYSKYSYDDYHLRKQIESFVRINLQKKQIAVNRPSKEIPILESTVFVKSADAGNYQFDPFCGSVQIKLKLSQRSSKEFFSQNHPIKMIDSDYEIRHTQVQKPEDWSKQTVKLNSDSSVEQIVEYVCEKRQQSEKIKRQLIKALRENGGAKTIQDMYSFEKQDFNTLKIKPALIFQIQEVIEIIKENSKIQSFKDQKKEKKQCLKVANSHKILRFLVYKNEGVNGVNKIAWLNMKNLQNAIAIVKEQIHNNELLQKLQKQFEQFGLTPKDKPIPFSRGLILYGPPGTGKTELTEALPNIMGFHLIQKGLSAADFNQSLVGQTARMIRDLVNRANYSPYLICSIGIDEVDGLVPDRKDKDQKSKGQGISMLLSVIGGNKNVSNLVFMTSTNYLKKIDEAIRRRLSGQYQVGRPNATERVKIIQTRMEYFKKQQNSQLKSHLKEITANFTGAAVHGLCNYLLRSLRKQEMNGERAVLTTKNIDQTACLIARQYSINLGAYTIPQIYMLNANRKHIFTENFLSNISNNLLFIKFDKNLGKYKMFYANKTTKYFKERMTEFYEQEEQIFELETKAGSDFSCFYEYVCATFRLYEIVIYNPEKFANFDTYVKSIQGFLDERRKRKFKNKQNYSLLIVKQFVSGSKSLFAALKLAELKMEKMRILYYLNSNVDEKKFLEAYLPSWKIKPNTNQPTNEHLKAKINIIQDEPKYTGKIFVELNQDVKMAFQLNPLASGQSKIAFKFFLRSENSNSPKDIIPQLVSFFTKKNVSYILMLDYQLLLMNDAFQEKKQFQVLQEKMSQAKNYDKAAVIINLDSLITISENASDSSMGRSVSYSIVNHNMYQIIINYIKEFAKVEKNLGKWICVIMKNKELINIVKKQLNWPSYPEDDEKRKEEEEKEKKKKCGRCSAFYTDNTNEEEPKCMQHKGKIIDVYRGCVLDVKDIKELRAELIKVKKKEKDKDSKKEKQKDDQNRFVFACCLKNLNEQGQTPYYHIEESQLYTEEDEHYEQREREGMKWEQTLKLLL